MYADFSHSLNFKDYKKHIIKNNIAKSYNELQKILNENAIALKTVSSNADSLKIVIRQNSYMNQTDVNRIILNTAKKIAKNKSKVFISQEVHKMEVVSVFYPTNKKVNIREENQGDFSPSKLDYIVVERYPIIKNSISPRLRTMIAAREGFLFTGLLLEDDLQIIFDENFYLTSNFKSSLIDDFDGLYLEPIDVYPNQVRSDIKKYLNNLTVFFEDWS